ncbi:MAG TPA: AtpZ/AtpI family protein [Longimicrobiales bacterium]|nr:AtpZ/AtpI family protein [Longimicrobiales bacterium]
MPEPNDARAARSAHASRYLGLGLTWVGATVFFLYIGSLADRWLDTKPVLSLVGALVGVVTGFYYVYREVVSKPETGSTTQGGKSKE